MLVHILHLYTFIVIKATVKTSSECGRCNKECLRVEIELGRGCFKGLESKVKTSILHFSPCFPGVGEPLGSTSILGTPKLGRPFRSSLSNN